MLKTQQAKLEAWKAMAEAAKKEPRCQHAILKTLSLGGTAPSALSSNRPVVLYNLIST